MKLTKLEVGDVVAYTGKFMRSIGAMDLETSRRRAKVVSIADVGMGKPGEFAKIQWNDEDEPHLIRRENVCRVTKAAGVLDHTV